jgi:REP element-mobilizing transposase RayT
VRKTRAFLLGTGGKTNYYHVVSRTAGQELLFGDAEREVFCQILLKQLRFSGLRALAWCFMGNHFHLLLEVPDKQAALAGLSEAMVLDRLEVFRGEFSTRLLLGDLESCRQNGDAAGASRIADRVRAHLFDLSMFMKELKQRMTLAYNSSHDRTGALWEGRFKSVILEGGTALRIVAAYIDLNPIRAGIVDDPKDYRWCSYAAAVAGSQAARTGLALALRADDRAMGWPEISAEYRKLVFGIGESATDPKGGSRLGFSREQAKAVWDGGGKLTLAEVLRCRVRYFSDGVALGSKRFLDEFFYERRPHFGAKRRDGGRRMIGAEWGELRVLRALRLNPISAEGKGTQSPPTRRA